MVSRILVSDSRVSRTGLLGHLHPGYVLTFSITNSTLQHIFQLHHLSITSPSVVPNGQDHALAQQFFDGNSSGQNTISRSSILHHTDIPQLSELSKLEIREQWALEQAQHLPAQDIPAWAAEFANVSLQNPSSSVIQQNIIPTSHTCEFAWIFLYDRPFSAVSVQQQRNYVTQIHGNSMPMPVGAFGMATPSTQYLNYPGVVSSKGKAKEIDFEAAFAQLDQSISSPQHQSSGIEDVDDTTQQVQEALVNTALQGEEDHEDHEQDFQTYDFC